ncbi:MAG: hypothetical protein RL272_106, partial [Candidatus Parcubacteria bacterium]
MTKTIQVFLIMALTAGAGALVGCGQTELDDRGSDTSDDDGTDGCGSCGSAAPSDAGRRVAVDGGLSDAGAADPVNDSGTTAPSSDAGSAAPDAGPSPAPDAGSPVADAGTPATHTAPLRSPLAGRLEFSDEYIGSSACGEIRGSLPAATWSSGPSIQDTNADRFLEYAPSSIAAGTYELSYVAATCRGPAGAWADYGSRTLLLGMTADARSFVNCSWWDAASSTTVTVGSPGCNLRITVD